MAGRRLHAKLVDRHFGPGKGLVEFLVWCLNAQVFGGEGLEVMLRIAKELLKIAIERLEPCSKCGRGGGRCCFRGRHQQRVDLIAISGWIEMNHKL